MNKILTKVTALCVGLAMATGVGVAVSAGRKDVSPAQADAATMAPGTNGSACTVNGNDGIKVGTSKKGGDMTITVGSGATSLSFYAAAWNGVSGLSLNLTMTVGSATTTSFALTADSGVSNNSPFTLSGTESSYLFTTELSSVTSESVITLASSTAKRFVVWNATYEAGSETSHSVTNSVSHGTISPLSVEDGQTLTATITPETWYSVPTSVSVTMGGTAVTHTYSNGVVTVQNVTGDIEISGSCVKTGGPAHAGTLADPYTIADAYMAIDASKATSGVYVQGIVSGIVTPWSSEHSNISFNISVDGETTGNQLQFYRCSSSTQHEITSDADIEIGATVIGFGNLTKYNSTYEYGQGCTVVSYTAPATTDYTISFNGNGTTGSMDSDSGHGKYTLPENGFDVPSGKMFAGWKAENDGDLLAAGDSYTVSEDVEFYAQWANICVVSFDAGEGSGTMSSINVAEGSDYTLPACTFTAPGDKVFDHWELNGVQITVIESIDEDVEVVAIYTDAPSEVEATMTAGTNGSAAVVIADEVENAAIKVGTSSKGGDMTLTVGAGAKYVKFYAAAWKGVTGLSLNITGAETDPTSVALNADDGISNSSPFTLAGNAGDFLFTVNLTGITEETVLTLTTSTTKRFVLWGAVYGTNGSPEPAKVLTGISVSGAKDSFMVNDEFVTTGLVVTAHYQDSPDATISSGYEVDSSSVDNTKAGEYTITVSYGGFDDTYSVTYSEPAPVETKTYKKVKTSLANFAGDYLIVYEEGSVAFDGSLENPDVTSNTFAVSITDEAISASEAYEFTVAKKEGGYSLKSASGLYIGKTADSNGMDKNASDNYTNTISYSGTEESDMDIVGSGKPHLRYNASSGQERFRFFKSESYTGQKAVSLYIEVSNDAEAFALDILNLTTEVCSAEGEHASGDFATAWSTLTTKYSSVVNKDLLVEGEADATGTFFAEALARYDILVAKYGLNPFMTGRVSNLAYIPNYQSNIDSSSSITIIVIVAVASMTLLGVTLVLRKRKHQ